MIETRPFVPEDLQTIAWWWAVRDFAMLPAAVLPPLGVVACEDGKPIAACFLYVGRSITGQGMGWAEWAVTMPGLSPRKAKDALEKSIRAIISLAKEQKCVFIFTSLHNRGLKKLYAEAGYTKTDEDVTQFIYQVGGA